MVPRRVGVTDIVDRFYQDGQDTCQDNTRVYTKDNTRVYTKGLQIKTTGDEARFLGTDTHLWHDAEKA